MVFQLPSAVDADAAGVIFYSLICLFANILLIWLTWAHNDRTSYIACIAYATLVVTATSVAQQFYDYAYWVDIMTDQFYYARDNADNAEVQYHKGARGVKLILSYIRIYGYTIESTFVFFFALSLAASVYGWFATTPRTTHTISIIGRVLPIVLTSITVGLMHSPPAQGSFTVYMLVANTQFVLSLLGSAILLLMILFKYVLSRRNLQTWNVLYGNAGSSLPSTNARSSKARSAWLGSISSRGGHRSRAYNGDGANNTYDSWLVIRLSIAFAVLCVFEYTNVVPRFAAASHTIDSADDLAPDLSIKRARSSVRGYVSGVTPSLVAFLVFGTTKAFQRKIVETFVPKRWQKRIKRRPKQNLSISFGLSGPSPKLTPAQRSVQQVDEFSLNEMNPKFPNSGDYSPRYPNDANLSPRLPHGTQSNPGSRMGSPRFAPSRGPPPPPPIPLNPALTSNPTRPRTGSMSNHTRSRTGSMSRPTTGNFSHLRPMTGSSNAPQPMARGSNPQVPSRPMTGVSVSGSLHSKFSGYGRDMDLPRAPHD